jgi:hypothetical protein
MPSNTFTCSLMLISEQRIFSKFAASLIESKIPTFQSNVYTYTICSRETCMFIKRFNLTGFNLISSDLPITLKQSPINSWPFLTYKLGGHLPPPPSPPLCPPTKSHFAPPPGKVPFS